ncbi:hypothetical protein BSQ98_09820 [Serratia liquefaciens]|uniref:hypothetical protein n=1 Tax=Serratia liquefaciens TaxID=614 RepID=UPI0010211E34|nr:hypothetical protein [Serratia liquefaciens]RYM66023.1 hypothetical protein BSQ98_09820 [Serratia liquefaciens]
MDNKLRKLAREIVEEVVDCDAADPEYVQQYFTWTERKLRSAILAELEEDKLRLNLVINSEANRADAAEKRMANREAQPVAWSYEWALCITCEGPQDFKSVIEREAPPQWAIDEGQARNVTPLYTAPPATAVPSVIAIPEAATLTNINQLCPLDSNLSQTDFATGWNDCRQYALTHDGLPPVIKGVHAAAQGWNACRAALEEGKIDEKSE